MEATVEVDGIPVTPDDGDVERVTITPPSMRPKFCENCGDQVRDEGTPGGWVHETDDSQECQAEAARDAVYFHLEDDHGVTEVSWKSEVAAKLKQHDHEHGAKDAHLSDDDHDHSSIREELAVPKDGLMDWFTGAMLKVADNQVIARIEVDSTHPLILIAWMGGDGLLRVQLPSDNEFGKRLEPIAAGVSPIYRVVG